MDLQSARLELLKNELSQIDGAIRQYDSISFQIKGWCVTVTIAIAGFAVGGHEQLFWFAYAVVVGFWLVDSQNRRIQRAFLRRGKVLRTDLVQSGLADVLEGKGQVRLLGSPDVFPEPGRPRRFLPDLWNYTTSVIREGVTPHTLGLYLFLSACLLAATILA